MNWTSVLTSAAGINWTSVLTSAAGINSVLSLCAFLGALFVWLAGRRRERSLREIVHGTGVINPQKLERILKSFQGDQARLQALKDILNNDTIKAESIVSSVRKNVDLGNLSLSQQRGVGATLFLVGFVLMGLAIIGSRNSGSSATGSTAVVKPNPDSGTESIQTKKPSESGAITPAPETPSPHEERQSLIEKLKITRANRVPTTRESLRSMATGLEAYFVDEGSYPPSRVPRRGSRTNDYSVFANIGNLTTPVSYMTKSWIDGLTQNGTVGYHSINNAEKKGWVLYDLGPDGRYSLPFKDYDPKDPRPDRTFINYIYDATNGLTSFGDVVRFGTGSY